MSTSDHDAFEAQTRVVVLPFTRAPRLVGFPTSLPLLIGREHEIMTVGERLRQPSTQLLTLIGPAGVGKSRLALAAAAEVIEDFADGAVFVALASIRDPYAVMPALASALDVRERADQPLQQSLAHALTDRPLLIVLDNLEHVAESAIDIAELLHACPRLTILATSRVPLRIRSEQRFTTAPLPLPLSAQPSVEAIGAADAVALFVERARRVQPAFQLTQANAAAVLAICARLDGLPLAIELAAAWSHVLPPSALLLRLQQGLALLSGGPADQPPRLQSMREAVAWSDALLPEQTRQLFYRLGMFLGGFTLEAAASLWTSSLRQAPWEADLGHEQSIEQLLATLVDASLIQSTPGPDGTPRFSMLETVRDYALERLAAFDLVETTARDHAMHYVRFVETVEPYLLGAEEAAHQGRVTEDLNNIRSALAWALEHDPEIALRIAGALWFFWVCQGLIVEGAAWLTKALQIMANTTSAEHRARALNTASALTLMQNDLELASQLHREASSLIEDLDEPSIRARTYFMRGAVHLQNARFTDAVEWLGRASEAFPERATATDRAFRAWTLAVQGMSAIAAGDAKLGTMLYERAWRQAEAAGSRFVTALTLTDFAGLLLESRDHERARKIVRHAIQATIGLDDITQRGELWPMGQILYVLAAIDAIDGKCSRAALRLGAGEAIMRRLGMVRVPPLQQRADELGAHLTSELGHAAMETLRTQGADTALSVVAELAEPLPLSSSVPEDGAVQGLQSLTMRERQVLHGITQGLTDREIAENLFISRKTASNHVTKILQKLAVPTRAAAAARAAASTNLL